MGLEPEMKRNLELFVDFMVTRTLQHMAFLNNKEVRTSNGIDSPRDYAFGLIVGGVFQGFLMHFVAENKREASNREIAELSRSIFSKAPDIWNAIENAGKS
jgi:hypothetical protein